MSHSYLPPKRAILTNSPKEPFLPTPLKSHSYRPPKEPLLPTPQKSHSYRFPKRAILTDPPKEPLLPTPKRATLTDPPPPPRATLTDPLQEPLSPTPYKSHSYRPPKRTTLTTNPSPNYPPPGSSSGKASSFRAGDLGTVPRASRINTIYLKHCQTPGFIASILGLMEPVSVM